MSKLITQDEFRRRFIDMGIHRFRLVRQRPDFPTPSPLSRPNRLLWLDDDADRFIRRFIKSGEKLPSMANRRKMNGENALREKPGKRKTQRRNE